MVYLVCTEFSFIGLQLFPVFLSKNPVWRKVWSLHLLFSTVHADGFILSFGLSSPVDSDTVYENTGVPYPGQDERDPIRGQLISGSSRNSLHDFHMSMSMGCFP